MKAKEYLMQQGIIKSAGRGRMPKGAHDILLKAYNEGVRFSNWTPDKTVSTTAPVISNEPESYDVTYSYPEDGFKAYEYDNGKKIERGMRCICRTCGVSLVVHACSAPEIVARDGGGWVRVYVEGR